MTPTETLEACRDMAREVALLERLVDSVSIPGPCCSSPRLTGMPRGGNDNTSAAIAKLEQYEKWRDRSRAILDGLIDAVDCILAALPGEDKMLMRLYYVHALTDRKCAMIMGFGCKQTAQARRKKILENLTQGIAFVGLDRYNGISRSM